MKDLIIEATKSSPFINFTDTGETLSITGESYLENAAEFYAPVFDWLKGYLEDPLKKPLLLDVELIYFNSSSSKILMNLFDMLNRAGIEGTPVTINWRYHEDNDVALECGEEFMEDLDMVHLSFNLIAISDGA